MHVELLLFLHPPHLLLHFLHILQLLLNLLLTHILKIHLLQLLHLLLRILPHSSILSTLRPVHLRLLLLGLADLTRVQYLVTVIAHHIALVLVLDALAIPAGAQGPVLLFAALLKFSLELLHFVHDDVALKIVADLLAVVLDEGAVEEHEHYDVELDLHFGLLGDVRLALRSEGAREEVDCGSQHEADDEFELDEVHPHLMPVIRQLLAISYQEHVGDARNQHGTANDALENAVVRVLGDVAVYFAGGEIVQNNCASDQHGRHGVRSPTDHFGIEHIHFFSFKNSTKYLK